MTDHSQSPISTPQSKITVFVDFWNYTLSMNSVDENFKTDWSKIGGELAAEAAKLVGAGGSFTYQGVHVTSSYDKNTEQGRKFRRWATNTLDKFAGVHVTALERQRKRQGPKCPKCYSIVENCPEPSCNADMRGTEEKGVDTHIVTQMMSLAWAKNFDVAVLVSADRDFVPVAEFLQTRGLKVVHGAFPPNGAVLSQKCWGSIDIPKISAHFQR